MRAPSRSSPRPSVWVEARAASGATVRPSAKGPPPAPAHRAAAGRLAAGTPARPAGPSREVRSAVGPRSRANFTGGVGRGRAAPPPPPKTAGSRRRVRRVFGASGAAGIPARATCPRIRLSAPASPPVVGSVSCRAAASRFAYSTERDEKSTSCNRAAGSTPTALYGLYKGTTSVRRT